jgi:hypothetical protein
LLSEQVFWQQKCGRSRSRAGKKCPARYGGGIFFHNVSFFGVPSNGRSAAITFANGYFTLLCGNAESKPMAQPLVRN